MGDKDNLLERILGFHGPILLPQSSKDDYEKVVKSLRDNRLIELSNSTAIKPTLKVPRIDKIPLFNFDIPKEQMQEYLKLMEQPLFDDNSTLSIRLLQQEVEKRIMSLGIEDEPKVNKPKNLKYPNKKRKRRVLKKWAKRFGVTPNQIMFPEAEVESFLAPNEDGILCWYFAVKPKKQK